MSAHVHFGAMGGRRQAIVALLCGLVGLAACAPSASAAPPTWLPCADYDTDIGEYGAWVFQLRERPSKCTHYRGNVPCHCTEAPLTGIRWRHWGSQRTAASATWHYCGMGTCIYRPASLVAYRLRESCGQPVYTRLRMKLPESHRRGYRYPAANVLFKLPACPGVFDYT
jgi:hypothetical protein